MVTEITAADIEILSKITTRDEAGRHFTQVYCPAALERLEEAGLIEVIRPVHEFTGLAYSGEYWHAQVTPDGIDAVHAAEIEG